MGEILDELQRLQEVEFKLAAMRRTREAKARRVETQSRQVREAEEKLRESQLTGRERQAKLDALALDVAAREESINKHRRALSKARTNKEYAAILAAMNTEKADNTKIENDMLRLMEDIQTLNDKRAEIESERTRNLEDTRAAERLLQRFDEESRQECAELQASRDCYSEKIAPTALMTFNRVAGRHDGEAMAFVEKLHPKRDEYLCGGCNMNVALEVVNSLQTRDEIQLCGACGRILHLETSTARRSET